MDEALLDMSGHPAGLSPEESRLAGDYVHVLDLVSRAAQALEAGSFTHLSEKAQDLSGAAQALAVSAAQAVQAEPSVRTSSVIAAVTARGWRLPAVQALHPGPYGTARPLESDA
ncbi:hypothetical protein [Streptomyces sp. NPDC051183]|uniref:hypothetical protein n=1 Tax=Streptomyces sp. NPDC051183 TaxID=3155165 RepID=UPI003440E46F